MRRLVAAGCVTAVVLCAAPAWSAPPRALRSFASCAQLNGYLQTQAIRRVGPFGLGGAVLRDGRLGGPVPAAAVSGPAREAQPAAPPLPEVAFSGTNVQEVGVDEPDVAKTNGRVLFAVARGRVQAVAVGEPTPRRLDALTLPGLSPETLLLSGQRLIVLSRANLEPVPLTSGPAGQARLAPDVAFNPPATVVSEVDVSDPSAMRVLSTLRLEGNLVTARQVGTSVRVVVSTPFDVVPVGATLIGVPIAGDQAAQTRRNRAALRRTHAGDWLPHYRFKGTGPAVRRGVIAGCKRIQAPVRFAGFGTVSIVTLDTAQGVRMTDTDTIVSGSDVVYASTSSLYVATSDWFDPAVWQERPNPPAASTRIHRFDIADPLQTTYRATGSVPGFVPGQWAMSERAGRLRVASTQEPSWWEGSEARPSESHVSVLGEQDGRLLRIGHVDGIGSGERITGVRFIDDIGYVVTFRRVDPLHIVDLSDPAAPVLRGELQIPGFSAYLHPVGPGLLLGIGQDADPQGRVLGTQFSLFDVANRDAPARIASVRLADGGFSEAEWDHKAFTYWAPTGLALVPFQDAFVSEPVVAEDVASFAKAAGIRVAGRTLVDAGRIAHPFVRVTGGAVSAAPIRRTVVVGGSVYSLSDDGVRASDLATLAPTGWLPFPDQ